MLELAQEVKFLTKSESKIEMQPLPGDDPKQREPDITKAKQVLGWEPVIERKVGLSKTIEYFRHLLSE